MRFAEIGQQLRAYRLESGLRAEEIAARLGVSRAALYRYEKGEVIKLDTIRRLAELLKISPLSLLGIGVEYFGRPAAFEERLRQVEEQADRLLARTQVEQMLGLLVARKKLQQARKSNIIALLGEGSVSRMLAEGIAAGLPLSERARMRCRLAARAEAEAIADQMESVPIGLQLGLIAGAEPSGPFMVLRGRERAHVVGSAFAPDAHPATASGVAFITAADEAVGTHQRVAEAAWRDALKGGEAASRLRELIREHAPA